MTDLTRPPARIPLVELQSGLISREWYRFFEQTFRRLGGSQGQSVTELLTDMADDAGIEELKLDMLRFAEADLQKPPSIDYSTPDEQSPPGAILEQPDDQSNARLEALESAVAELLKAINDIKQGSTP